MADTPVPPSFDDMPINNIEWIDVNELRANSWNPNFVMGPEFKLIKHSLMTSGWIQPILVSRETDGEGGTYFEIVDGFHRSTLAKTDKDIAKMTAGRVPCAVIDMTVAERKMLTVRINRAKGTHQATLMHDLVKSLIYEHEVPVSEVCKGIGADEHEVNTLLLENVFEKLGSDKHKYSEAWRPRKKGEPLPEGNSEETEEAE